MILYFMHFTFFRKRYYSIFQSQNPPFPFYFPPKILFPPIPPDLSSRKKSDLSLTLLILSLVSLSQTLTHYCPTRRRTPIALPCLLPPVALPRCSPCPIPLLSSHRGYPRSRLPSLQWVQLATPRIGPRPTSPLATCALNFSDAPQSTVVSLLFVAWQHDSSTSLKLVCNLRGWESATRAGLALAQGPKARRHNFFFQYGQDEQDPRQRSLQGSCCISSV